MSETYSARLTIGGSITRAALADLHKAAVSEGAELETPNEEMREFGVEDIAQTIIEEGTLTFIGEAAMGRFSEIEAVAKQHELLFSAWSASYFESPEETVVFDGVEEESLGMDDGYVSVSGKTIEEMLLMLKSSQMDKLGATLENLLPKRFVLPDALLVE